jgi:hypothetical protein
MEIPATRIQPALRSTQLFFGVFPLFLCSQLFLNALSAAIQRWEHCHCCCKRIFHTHTTVASSRPLKLSHNMLTPSAVTFISLEHTVGCQHRRSEPPRPAHINECEISWATWICRRTTLTHSLACRSTAPSTRWFRSVRKRKHRVASRRRPADGPETRFGTRSKTRTSTPEVACFVFGFFMEMSRKYSLLWTPQRCKP